MWRFVYFCACLFVCFLTCFPVCLLLCACIFTFVLNCLFIYVVSYCHVCFLVCSLVRMLGKPPVVTQMEIKFNSKIHFLVVDLDISFNVTLASHLM